MCMLNCFRALLFSEGTATMLDIPETLRMTGGE